MQTTIRVQYGIMFINQVTVILKRAETYKRIRVHLDVFQLRRVYLNKRVMLQWPAPRPVYFTGTFSPKALARTPRSLISSSIESSVVSESRSISTRSSSTLHATRNLSDPASNHISVTSSALAPICTANDLSSCGERVVSTDRHLNLGHEPPEAQSHHSRRHFGRCGLVGGTLPVWQGCDEDCHWLVEISCDRLQRRIR